MSRPAAAGAFVLDASVTASWLLPDERTAAAESAYLRLRSRQLDAHAPELWLWECGNVIANGVKRQRIAPADAPSVWGLLDAIRMRVALSTFEPAQVCECLALAVDESLSIYDAAYLWLARTMSLPLLSHDERLCAAAARKQIRTLRMEQVA